MRDPGRGRAANRSIVPLPPAKLKAELAREKCPLCQSVGCWEVTSSPKAGAGEAKVRYLKCIALRPRGSEGIIRAGKDPP